MDSKAKTRLETEADKKKWAMKHFDYAESAIKEWVADILEEDIDTLFDDYTGESDIIGVKSDNDTYTMYLTSFPEHDLHFDINREELKANHDLSKATSIMYDSVNTTYMPVIKTMSSMNHRMENIFPKFDEDNMCFYLVMTNKHHMERMRIMHSLRKIEDNIEKIKNIPEDRRESVDGKKAYNQIIAYRNELIGQFNDIDVDMCRDLQKIVDDRNVELEAATKLYICFEKNKENIDQSILLKRMPEFGMRYQDPDEDTYIDKFKEEFNIN
jgi:hypothetical protein